MKKALITLLVLMAGAIAVNAQTPVLGSYPSSTIATASGNTFVAPDNPPVNAASIIAFTSAGFKGELNVNPVTGIVTITNAHPAGNYIIHVKAFNAGAAVATEFPLRVNNTLCSQGYFSEHQTVEVGDGPLSITVADINNDGKQDLVTSNFYDTILSISLGDGAGRFAAAQHLYINNCPSAITIADFDGDGHADIAATLPIQNSITVKFGDGLGGFGRTLHVPVGTGPLGITSGDFNNDGIIDLASANSEINSISILLNDGTGHFLRTVDVPVGLNPNSIAVDDFNNDGNLDFATANHNINTVSIRLGDGTGYSFNAASEIVVTDGPNQIVTGDFNKDGIPDFATVNWSGFASVRFGDGKGSFTGIQNLRDYYFPYGIATGDLNGDGNEDFIACDYYGKVSLRLGNSYGVFTTDRLPSSEIPMLYYALTSIAIGDFNQDGLQDFAVTSVSLGNIIVMLAKPDLTEIAVKGNNKNITDGDTSATPEKLTDFGEVANGASAAHKFSIYNSGTEKLKIQSIKITGEAAYQYKIAPDKALPVLIASGDAMSFTVNFNPSSAGLKIATVNIQNNDCDEKDYDFTIKGKGITNPGVPNYPATIISFAGGNAQVFPTPVPTNITDASAVAYTNFKGLISINPTNGIITITNAYPAGRYIVYVKMNSGTDTISTNFELRVNNNSNCNTGIFTKTGTTGVGPNPSSLAIADFNNDGMQDLAIANRNDSSVSIRLGNGKGGFTSMPDVPVWVNPTCIAVADFNSDGRLDFAVLNNDQGMHDSISVCFGDGTGKFIRARGVDMRQSNYPWGMVIGDFDGDRIIDIAVAIAWYTAQIYHGDGSGRFIYKSNVWTQSYSKSIFAADFNNDFIQDFIVSKSDPQFQLSISMSNNAGAFESNGAQFEVGHGDILAHAAADFNNDGYQDFATSNGNQSLSIFEGNGSGSFTEVSNILLPYSLISLSTGDLNGDGNIDLLGTAADSAIVSFGNGHGGFTHASINVGTNPIATASGDFNNDGKQDFAVLNNGSNNVTIVMGSASEINVIGNNTTIADGDNSPSPADHTSFGNVVMGNTRVRTYTIQNNGTVNLNVNGLDISGTDAALFTIGGLSLPVAIPPGQSESFTVAFSPVVAGVKTATVNITNDDCDEGNYDFALQANGTLTDECLTSGSRLYVDINSTSPGTGNSWNCPLSELSQAVATANATPSIKEIWVAGGTYKPTITSNRGITMVITRADLKILGGFAGNETDAATANPITNPTIISGDIGTHNDMSDNSFHLFDIHMIPASASPLIIDGFTLEKANAVDQGAAVYSWVINAATNVTFSRCKFINNNVSGNGAAVSLNSGTINFDGCLFKFNNATSVGGAVYTVFSSPVFNNTVFDGNTAGFGGAVYGNYGYPKFNRTAFTANSATLHGGAVYQNRMNAVYNNCVFNANSSNTGGAMYLHNASFSHIVNSTLYKNSGSNAGGAIALNYANSNTTIENSIFYQNTAGGSAASPWADYLNYTAGSNTFANNILQKNTSIPADNGTTCRNNIRGANPLFSNEANPVGADNAWGTADDGLSLALGSPAINAGDNTLAQDATDITNSQRIVCSRIDMGAYEYQACTLPPAPMLITGSGTLNNKLNSTSIVANPFTNELQIRYTNTENADITIYSVSGKTMWTNGNASQGLIRVNSSTWNSGIYEVVITTATGHHKNYKVLKL